MSVFYYHFGGSPVHNIQHQSILRYSANPPILFHLPPSMFSGSTMFFSPNPPLREFDLQRYDSSDATAIEADMDLEKDKEGDEDDDDDDDDHIGSTRFFSLETTPGWFFFPFIKSSIFCDNGVKPRTSTKTRTMSILQNSPLCVCVCVLVWCLFLGKRNGDNMTPLYVCRHHLVVRGFNAAAASNRPPR